MRASTVKFQPNVLNKVFALLLVALFELVHVDVDRLLNLVSLALLFCKFLADDVDVVDRVDDLPGLPYVFVRFVYLVFEVLFQLRVDFRYPLNFILQFLHFLRFMVHFGCHLLDLNPFVFPYFLHFTVDHLFALFQLLVLAFQIDEALPQPVDIEILVRFACFLSLARFNDFA